MITLKIEQYLRNSEPVIIPTCILFLIPGWVLRLHFLHFLVVANFNNVEGSFHVLSANTRDILTIPSFRNWGHVLYVEYISCVITNCGQRQ